MPYTTDLQQIIAYLKSGAKIKPPAGAPVPSVQAKPQGGLQPFQSVMPTIAPPKTAGK